MNNEFKGSKPFWAVIFLALAGFAGGDYADAGCAMTNLTSIRFWAIFALLALGYVLGQLAAFVK